MLVEINERGLKKLHFANHEMTAAEFFMGLTHGHAEYLCIEKVVQTAIHDVQKALSHAAHVTKYEVFIEVNIWN